MAAPEIITVAVVPVTAIIVAVAAAADPEIITVAVAAVPATAA